MQSLGIVILLCLLALGAEAQIYKWVDETGKTHFSDKPFPQQEAEEVELQELNTLQAIPAQAAPRYEAPPPPIDTEREQQQRDLAQRCREANMRYRGLTVGAPDKDGKTMLTVLTQDGKNLTRREQNAIAEQFRQKMNARGCNIPAIKNLKK